MKVLVIDNYDSFVYNLVQYIGELGGDPVVYRNDQITLAEAVKMAPIVRALKQTSGAEVRVLATAQHRGMLDQVLSALYRRVDRVIGQVDEELPIAPVTDDLQTLVGQTVGQIGAGLHVG